MYSWYPSDVLNILGCTHGIPSTCIMISLRCTEHPRCTHDIPPMYSWYPPDVLNTSDVLNIPRCTEHTLYRVLRPLGYSSPVWSSSKIDVYWLRSQEDGGCLNYLFLNNENYDACLPPCLWINKTQFGKKSNTTF